ncbi:chorismate--pyruvate lyase family protein [Paenibacillus massiliensis]|uniref:chorismate--pyruvate lyase family protein n=1 Tax=Paenibacillus massiliensis TaxID=225917 RepID=UPI00046FB23A|nr:chorismate pyruvate-lyase family protein [Paenibacillus massiliensis]
MTRLEPCPRTNLEACLRMLLRSDGSTTTLLEALLNTELGVQVLQQSSVPAQQLSEHIRQLLKLAEPSELLNRISRLATPEGSWVSHNHVVARLDRIQTLLGQLHGRNIPIGRALTGSGSLTYRQQLGWGVRIWEENDEHTHAVFKHYVIHTSDGPAMYIHETFHPAYVPVPASMMNL